jgi:hypothetical protein
MPSLAVDAPNREVSPNVPRPGEPYRKRARSRNAPPGAAAQRAQKVSDRLGQPLVGRFGERQPSPGIDFPVVDTRESVRREGLEHPRYQPEQSFDLDNLALAEDCFEPVQEGESFSPECFVDEVDVETNVPPWADRRSGWVAGASRGPAPEGATAGLTTMRAARTTRRTNPPCPVETDRPQLELPLHSHRGGGPSEERVQAITAPPRPT